MDTIFIFEKKIIFYLKKIFLYKIFYKTLYVYRTITCHVNDNLSTSYRKFISILLHYYMLRRKEKKKKTVVAERSVSTQEVFSKRANQFGNIVCKHSDRLDREIKQCILPKDMYALVKYRFGVVSKQECPYLLKAFYTRN